MIVRIGAGISEHADPLTGAVEAARAAADGLRVDRADLVVTFASGDHLAAPEATLERIHGVLAPGSLVGCGAGGVLGAGQELESGTAIAVWAATLHGAEEATAFHASVSPESPELRGLPDVGRSSGLIMLCDPYSFPTEAVLGALADAAPGVPILGGLSSAGTHEGTSALFLDDEVCESGAVGLCLEGIEMLPCVSQGAAPLGREVTITSAEGNLIHELAGRPAVQTIERIITELPARERALVAEGLLIGLVIDSGKPEYVQGDFLVRGVLGADPDSGAIAIGATASEGQVVRLHARDGRSADEELRRELGLRAAAIADRPPAGALVFSCNGRGQAMFGVPDHDATAVRRELRGAPAAGFFAAGEIGPVGGRNFLHGFTATVAVFPG